MPNQGCFLQPLPFFFLLIPLMKTKTTRHKSLSFFAFPRLVPLLPPSVVDLIDMPKIKKNNNYDKTIRYEDIVLDAKLPNLSKTRVLFNQSNDAADDMNVSLATHLIAFTFLPKYDYPHLTFKTLFPKIFIRFLACSQCSLLIKDSSADSITSLFLYQNKKKKSFIQGK